MSIQKNFTIRNGLEVNNNLIFADTNSNKVGIATTIVNYTLHVNGGIGVTNILATGVGTIPTLNSTNAYISNAYINSGIITATQLGSQNLNVSGISTINNVVLNGYLSIGNTTGKDGQVLVSTGAGVTWSKLAKNSILITASAGQDTFYFNYNIGSVEIYINGVRLSPNEFTAQDGSTVVLNDPCFGDETVEILASQTLPVGTTEVPIGIEIQDNNVLVGTAYSIRTLNFLGAGVTATAVGSDQVNVTINAVTRPSGKTVFVTTNGNDSNDGLTLEYAKRTIKAAVGITSSGDTVIVSPGTYKIGRAHV